MVGGRCPESAPGGARTRDLPLRRRLLYPTELRRLTHRNRWPRKNRKRPRPGGTVRVRTNGSGPLSSIAGSVVTRRQIGRASCRERVWGAGEAGRATRKRGRGAAV